MRRAVYKWMQTCIDSSRTPYPPPPSCNANLYAGPQSWPAWAYWRASFLLPETRGFWTSLAVACNEMVATPRVTIFFPWSWCSDRNKNYLNLVFWRNVFHAMDNGSILSLMSTTALTRWEKFCHCHLWTSYTL